MSDQQALAVKAHLDKARHNCDLTMACIWGAIRATAPADRWDMAAAGLQAAADAIAAAQAALAAMDKEEAYCTVCGEPVLYLMAGWAHISSAGHEPELDWRPVGADRKGNDGG